MPAGRPRKPRAIKDAEGNLGNRPINEAEPIIGEMLSLAPPAYISKAAKTIWTLYAKGMTYGVLTAVDQSVFAAFCEAEATRRALQAAMDKAPLTVTGSTGQTVVNPLLRQINDQARLLVTLSAKLGFDPVSRQSIHVGVKVDPDEDDFGIETVQH